MNRPPMDLEAVTARHISSHVQNAAADLRAALKPLQSSTRWRDSQLARNLRAALKETELAEKTATSWWDDVRAQASQGDLLEDGGADV